VQTLIAGSVPSLSSLQTPGGFAPQTGLRSMSYDKHVIAFRLYRCFAMTCLSWCLETPAFLYDNHVMVSDVQCWEPSGPPRPSLRGFSGA